MSRLITPAEWKAQPWKNGLGVTHEVWRSPASTGEYDVRVSVAEDTTPAPFSRFPGYRRWSTLIEPAPITLRIDGVIRELAKVGDYVEHDGEAIVESTALPAGPTKLLNVLARPGLVVGVGVPPMPVWFAFALDRVTSHSNPVTVEIDRWNARVFDPSCELAAPVLWIARSGLPERR